LAHFAGRGKNLRTDFQTTHDVAVLKALIFDFDGTLAETERDGHRVAYNEAFADLGLAWHWDEELYGRLLAVAGGKERVVHYIETADPPRPNETATDIAARVHWRKIARFAALASKLKLRPGIARIIAEAKAARLGVAIATTASETGVRDVLGQVPGLLDSFDVIAAGDVVARKKPAPDIYQFALRLLSVGPQEAVAFEDSTIGLTSALAAGIRTVVTPSLYTAGDDFTGAAVVRKHLDAYDQTPALDLAELRKLVA
jgi:HAD superfamily hydrolase (TIGR01509 family)